jgi:diguanylate cyclase (GGDEF)-like protein
MNKAQILFVGDFDRAFLKHVSNENWEIKHKAKSEEAITLLDKEKITLIIAKDKIEHINGYQLCLLIKSNPETRNLPFYILGEKKQSRSITGSIFAQPDRVAEYSEVLKKPQSLVKLLSEDLREFGKNPNLGSRQVQLLPACSAAELGGEINNKIDSEILLERFISTNMLSLSQYLNECFSVFNRILKADLFGMAISSLHKPWSAFSGSKTLNQQSFDQLINKVEENFILGTKMSLIASPSLTEKGGAVISDSLILSVVSESSTAGRLIIAKYDNQKFSPLERAIIAYIERYSKPLFEFLIAEQAMDKVLSREAVRAAVDPLTGLYNLEFLIGFLQQQLLFSFRNKLAVSLLMVDVDRFSQINGALGQAVADTILVKLAERLLSLVRGSDLLARYNSDKFVVVLPNTPLKGARVLAEKIRLEIEQTNFFAGRQPGPGVTVSVGLAEYDPHDLNPETILKEAKMALQKAKENGRNKVAL